MIKQSDAARLDSYKYAEIVESFNNIILDYEVRISTEQKNGLYYTVGYVVRSLNGGITVPRFAHLFETFKDFMAIVPEMTSCMIDKYVGLDGVDKKCDLNNYHCCNEIMDLSNGRMRELNFTMIFGAYLDKTFAYERNIPIRGSRYAENEPFFVTTYELFNLLKRDKYKGCIKIGSSNIPTHNMVLKANCITNSLDLCRLTEYNDAYNEYKNNGAAVFQNISSYSVMEYKNIWILNEHTRGNNIDYKEILPYLDYVQLLQGLYIVAMYKKGTYSEKDVIVQRNNLRLITSSMKKWAGIK